MLKLLVGSFFIIMLFSVKLSAKEEAACEAVLFEYKNEFGGLSINKNHTEEEALKYLLSNEQICQTNAVYYFIRSNVLYDLAKYDEALTLLNKAIKRKAVPLGTVLYQKANIMRRLTQWQVRNYDYSMIRDLLIEAENAEHTNGVLIYLELAEVLVLMNELDEAMKILNSAVVLDPSLFRFFSLAAIIETKQENFQTAEKYMNIAIQKGGQTSLNQPDSVLAFATIHCHNKRNEEARIMVDNIRNLISERDELTDLIAAKKVVDECKQ